MKIVIDCRMLGLSGIGAYIEGCLPCFLDSANEFILLGEKEKIKDLVGDKNNYTIEEYSCKAFSFSELLFFSKSLLCKINSSDLYYSPYFNIPGGIKVPVFTTIHDIIFPDMPDLVSFIGLKARMFFYLRAAHRSQKIFTVSEFSKTRIEHHLGTKTRVINASNAIKIPSVEIHDKTIIKRKNILFIGNIKKHKGLKILIDAFLNCKKEGLDYQLIIVGAKNNFRSSDEESVDFLKMYESEGIIFTGIVSNTEKFRLLRESALLVQPSLYEGFGYPPLEAMVSGTPALISDIPVFMEVYGEFPAIFFQTGNSKDLKAKIMELLYKKNPPAFLLQEYLQKKYSFDKITKKILEEFSETVH